jgi:hypothetical protein
MPRLSCVSRLLISAGANLERSRFAASLQSEVMSVPINASRRYALNGIQYFALDHAVRHSYPSSKEPGDYARRPLRHDSELQHDSKSCFANACQSEAHRLPFRAAGRRPLASQA